jgi:hypothetical protein
MKWKYQLLLQFPFSSPTDFDSVIVLEDAFVAELGNKALVDGHDAGSDEMNIFIRTNEPERIFETILSSHRSDHLFSGMKAGYRSFASDNYTTLWPKGLKRRFIVK